MTRRLIVEADGGSRGNPGPAGYGALVRDADTGEVLAERAASVGRASNNVAEYRGLVAGLTAALELDPTAQVEARMDSKLVVEQMSGRWRVKHPDMKPLAGQAADLVRRLGSVRFTWVPRADNAHADRLANEAMDAADRGVEWSASPAAQVPEPEPGEPEPGEPESAVSATRSPNRLAGWMDAPAPPTTTLLLRHGQTALSVQRRFSGRGDPSLTDLGRAQARALAARVRGLGADVVVSSPLARAVETATEVAGVLDLDVTVEDGLVETDFGDWEGHTFAQVRERWPDEMAAWLADPDVAPPGGESFTDTTTRVQQALGRLLASYPQRTLVCVTHVTPIKTLARLALQAPPVALYRLHLDLTAVSEIDWFADGPALLRRFNDTCHLDALRAP